MIVSHLLSQSFSGKDKAEPDRPTTGVVVDATTVRIRKKGTGVRAWLVLDSTGQARVVEVGKYVIMRRTGLPARDLRILDPFLLYPSRILGRERAIVINLEHIKAIITAHELLLLNSRDPSVKPFVEELHRRVLRFHHATKTQEKKEDIEKRDGSSKVLPFEFVALEACLEAACTCLDSEVRTLEQEAHPAMDKLTSKVTSLNLERVRQIKSRLGEITGRVQKVRDELEHLLDDDEDMAVMYLTEKMAQQNPENSSVSSIDERGGLDESDMDDRNPTKSSVGPIGLGFTKYEDDLQTTGNPLEHLFGASKDNLEIQTITTRSAISKHLGVGELEMLLEAYFVQVDGTLNKLSTLKEYIDDTEDYINIMLDDKQNHLLQMGIMLSTANLVLNIFVVIVGVLGMNIQVELFLEDVSIAMPKFLWTAGAGTAGTIFLYIMAIAWYKHKRLLQ